MQMILVSTVILVFRSLTATYRVDLYAIDPDLHLLDCLELEGHVLHCPFISSAFHGRFNDECMSDGLLAGAAPHLVATAQQLYQIVDVEWSARAVTVVGSH